MARPRHLRRFLFACACLVVLFAPPAALAAEAETWRHGVLVAKADAGFAFMAARRGFAERQGIALDIIEFRSDAIALRALIAGELDSYDGSPGGPMIAFAQGARVRITGCHWPGLTYGIFTAGDIGSVAELRGRVIAISVPGALPDLLVRAVLAEGGVAPDEVRFAPLGGDVDRFHALAAGLADAAAASTELVPEAEARGLKLLVHAEDAMPDYLRLCTYMTAATLEERGAAAARYLAAHMEAMAHALSAREETIGLAREVLGADGPGPAYIFDEVVRRDAVDPDMAVPRARLEWMQTLLIGTGNLSAPIDINALVDERAREEALRLRAAAP